jgi:hypothetical protein
MVAHLGLTCVVFATFADALSAMVAAELAEANRSDGCTMMAQLVDLAMVVVPS